jgi:hypothetical protein
MTFCNNFTECGSIKQMWKYPTRRYSNPVSRGFGAGFHGLEDLDVDAVSSHQYGECDLAHCFWVSIEGVFEHVGMSFSAELSDRTQYLEAEDIRLPRDQRINVDA